MRTFTDLAVTLYEMAKPVTAKVDEPAVGAGCNLALGYDLVLATPRSRFSEIFVQRGLSLDSEARSSVINLATDAPAAKQAFLARTVPVFDGKWRA